MRGSRRIDGYRGPLDGRAQATRLGHALSRGRCRRCADRCACSAHACNRPALLCGALRSPIPDASRIGHSAQAIGTPDDTAAEVAARGRRVVRCAVCIHPRPFSAAGTWRGGRRAQMGRSARGAQRWGMYATRPYARTHLTYPRSTTIDDGIRLRRASASLSPGHDASRVAEDRGRDLRAPPSAPPSAVVPVAAPYRICPVRVYISGRVPWPASV